jgi:hypothetical protein
VSNLKGLFKFNVEFDQTPFERFRVHCQQDAGAPSGAPFDA